MNTKFKLPKWIEERYFTLWNNFGSNPFRMEDAKELFQQTSTTTKDEVPLVLSELSKVNWIEVEFDPTDRRKRIYSLKSRNDIIHTDLLNMDDDIENILWSTADLMRNGLDYNYIVILLFLKKISGDEKINLDKREYSWDILKNQIDILPDYFSFAFNNINQKYGISDLDIDDFINLKLIYNDQTTLKNLMNIIELLKNEDLNNFLNKWTLFNYSKKKNLLFNTPKELGNLLIRILDPKSEDKIYDPVSGSNDTLIECYKYLSSAYELEKHVTYIFGQEKDKNTYIMGIINLYLNNVENISIAFGDSLLESKFETNGELNTFDLVIGHPPWNQSGYSENNLKKSNYSQQFKYGFVSKQSADWAWIQHMIASTNSNGRIGVIMDNGSLFRSGKEKKIRSEILREDFLESIILLPNSLFYDTSVNGSLIIFNKNKPANRKNKVLFINAVDEFVKHPELKQKNILNNQNIDRIKNVYDRFMDIENFSKVVSYQEIKENDYNSNVPLYFLKTIETEDFDIKAKLDNLKNLEKEYKELFDDMIISLQVVE